MATLISLFSFRPRNSQKDFTRFFRRFSHFSKEIRNQAVLENATYRMVFKVDRDKPPEIWIEKSKQKILLGSEKESKEKFFEMYENINKKKSSLNNGDEKKKKKDSEGFSRSERFHFDDLNPPEGLILKKIEVSGVPVPLVDEGLILFHYFPQGRVEQASIVLSAFDNQLTWTLLSDPITGAFYSFPGEKSLKELQRR